MEATIARNRENSLEEEIPGVTMGDVLHSLAVHNAYHMGKIVVVRQLIGAWPPAGESES